MNHFKKTALLGFAFSAALLLSQTANATISVLDFDSFKNGRIINDQYKNSHGVTINSVNYKGDATNSSNHVIGRQVAFNTRNDNSRDDDLEFNNPDNDYQNVNSPYRYTALNIEGYQAKNHPGKVLILQENNIGCGDGRCNKPDDEGSRAAGYFEFSFSNLVSILNIDFFDVEDQVGQDSKYFAIQFFDNQDNEIHKNHYVPSMGDGQFVRQAFSGIDGVKRLVLNMPGSGAIDNLAFKATEVPEPATMALLAVAFLLSIRHKLLKKKQD